MEGAEWLQSSSQLSDDYGGDAGNGSTQQVSSLQSGLPFPWSRLEVQATNEVDAARKRKRSGTPVDLDAEGQQQGKDVDQSTASDADTTLTRPGPSKIAHLDPKQAPGLTSEGDGDNDDTARSVLFSEQVKAEIEIDYSETHLTHATSTSVKGNLGDYIPQPEPALEVQAHTDMTGATVETDIAEFIKEEYVEDVKEQEQGPGEDLEESQDQNDVQDGEDGGTNDDLAKPAPWLTEPCQLERKPRAERLATFMREMEGTRKKRHPPTHAKWYNGSDEDSEDDDILDYTGQPNEADAEEIPPLSYHSGDSSQYDMEHRPILERTAVKRDIRQFQTGVKCLRYEDTGEYVYRIVDRLGEGTFSSVYRAFDTFHHYFNNEDWTYQRDNLPRSYIEDQRSSVQVALKKILVTSSPARIENELAILESLRGCENVSKLITAFREEDQVIIVMPYHRTDDFRHFYRHMNARHMRNYMTTLLRALRDIHRRGIIHRDVKPANFLYNYQLGDGVLCDFGLAERYSPPAKPTCQHGPATLDALHGKRTKTGDTATVEQAVYDARKRAKLGDGRVGFNHDDKRPQIKTNRAGTRGFRAPEVLLKCPDQTVAIDIWSAGVILLSILTHKFPVFNSSDDIEALMEIAAVFGKNQMERCAMLHNRTIITNVPTVETPPDSLASIILRLNPHIYTPPDPDTSREEAEYHIVAVDNAIDLCTRLLRLDATKRITAAAALEHPFLALDEYEQDVHRPTGYVELLDPRAGRCGQLHGYVDGKHKAYFGTELVEMHFGQGIPTTRTELCPEHEHWQQRTVTNVLAVSNRFPDEEQQTQPPTSQQTGALFTQRTHLSTTQQAEAPATLPPQKSGYIPDVLPSTSQDRDFTQYTHPPTPEKTQSSFAQRTHPPSSQIPTEDGVLAERSVNRLPGKSTADHARDRPASSGFIKFCAEQQETRRQLEEEEEQAAVLEMAEASYAKRQADQVAKN